MDEMFITCILDIVDPNRELSPIEIVDSIKEKFIPDNKNEHKQCAWCNDYKTAYDYNFCPDCGCKL